MSGVRELVLRIKILTISFYVLQTKASYGFSGGGRIRV